MSGHSKWNNIKRKKEKTDAQKGKIFTKVGREISVAVKQGGPDPSSNSKLKECISKAKSLNVPNDNIEKIIRKASGGSSIDCEGFNYEGYGPGNIAFIVSILTDNKNRTASNIRMYFDKFGGNLGSPGCVSYMFDERGIILIEKQNIDEEKLLQCALDCGTIDFQSDDEFFIIITEKNDFENIKLKLQSDGYNLSSSEISMVPQFYQKIEDVNTKEKLLNFIDTLENDDDVDNVWCNYEFN